MTPAEREKEPLEPAPEGANCAEHPDALALVTCPRCGSYCCPACWQGTHRLCHACLMRSPIEPVPWEQRERNIASRWFWTFANAIRPRATAASFATASPRRALWFALLSLVPVAAMAGVIPFTHDLRFGPRWEVGLLHDPTQADLALDVLQAMGLGIFIAIVELGVVAGVTSALVRVWIGKESAAAHLAAVLYRGWLLPTGGLSGLVLGVMIWGFPRNVTAPEGLPETMAEALPLFAHFAAIAPLLLLTGALISTARQASGIGPIKAMIVGLLPVVALITIEPMLFQLLAPLLPSSAPPPG